MLKDEIEIKKSKKNSIERKEDDDGI